VVQGLKEHSVTTHTSYRAWELLRHRPFKIRRQDEAPMIGR